MLEYWNFSVNVSILFLNDLRETFQENFLYKNSEYLKMLPKASNYFQMLPTATTDAQMLQHASNSFQIFPNASKCCHNQQYTGASILLQKK